MSENTADALEIIKIKMIWYFKKILIFDVVLLFKCMYYSNQWPNCLAFCLKMSSEQQWMPFYF